MGPVDTASQRQENLLFDGTINDNMQPRFDDQKIYFCWYVVLGTDVDEYRFQFQTMEDFQGLFSLSLSKYFSFFLFLNFNFNFNIQNFEVNSSNRTGKLIILLHFGL